MLFLTISKRHQVFYLSIYKGKPGPPQDLDVGDITETSIALDWSEPNDDGGSKITRYVIEKREASKRTWSPVGTTNELELDVGGLSTGVGYFFRVAAENECGVGEFVELDKPATPKSQFSKCKSSCLLEKTALIQLACHFCRTL